VSESITRIFIGVVVIMFVSVSLMLTKPVSDGGRLARKLCIANAAGWLFILPLSSRGHPPPFLIPTVLFWLINLVLLPAAAFALWASYKEHAEEIPYLAVASSYIVLNLVILFVVPFVWVLREASR
jgi:hypothetical protein